MTANEPISERTRFGFDIEKAGCSVSVLTRSSVFKSGVVACSTNQVTAAEFIPLPSMETRLAIKTSRNSRLRRMVRMPLRDWMRPPARRLVGIRR